MFFSVLMKNNLATTEKIIHHAVFRPPIITGETTINEGGTLSLNCDSSNSNQEPLVKWLNKDSMVVSMYAQLKISNILRSQAGNYSCQTFPPNFHNSTTSSVTVVVQCM